MPWNPKQLEWLNSIHKLKRLEYLASRYLIYQITGKLDSHLFKDESGKLHLDDSNQHLSISHSDAYIGLALSEKVIGFDLQKSASKINRIAKRFLSDKENDTLKAWNSEKNMIQAWTIKEAVYKAYGKKGILFSSQIQLDLSKLVDHQFKITQSTLKLPDYEKSYRIHHEWIEDFGWALATEL